MDNSSQNNKTYIIAEMSANHAGSKDRALEIIHAAKEAGADCIKIQTYTPDTMTIDCNNKYFNITDGPWKGDNLYSLYKKAYTPWEWQADLKAEADKIGIDFLSTPFDKTAVDFLESIGVMAYKISSFELVDIPLIKYTASKGKPIFLSTGMGSLEEIAEAVDAVFSQNNYNLTLLKCSSAYPAITDQMNLMVMADLKKRFSVKVGLSDHSMGHLGAVTAVAMGASVIEKHFCIIRDIESSDSSFSMEAQEFKVMVDEIRKTELAIGNVIYGATKCDNYNLEYRRSIFVVADIKKGENFTEDNIRVIRPAAGLKPKYYESIINKTASCDILRGTPLDENMIAGGLR